MEKVGVPQLRGRGAADEKAVRLSLESQKAGHNYALMGPNPVYLAVGWVASWQEVGKSSLNTGIVTFKAIAKVEIIGLPSHCPNYQVNNRR